MLYIGVIQPVPQRPGVRGRAAGTAYHPGHVRKLLHTMGFSVQRPRRVLARADAAAQDRWRRHTYPNLKEKPTGTTGR